MLWGSPASGDDAEDLISSSWGVTAMSGKTATPGLLLHGQTGAAALDGQQVQPLAEAHDNAAVLS
jgi:hypothetical protein